MSGNKAFNAAMAVFMGILAIVNAISGKFEWAVLDALLCAGNVWGYFVRKDGGPSA